MIREMQDKDWESIVDIYRQSLERGDVTFTTECPTYEEWDSAHIKECRYVYVEDGKVVGYTMIAPTSKREPYRGVVEVSIYVDKDYQGRHIGTELLETLCDETEKKGYWTLYSAIFSINVASIELHKKCGFRVIGYRENIAKDKYGQWQNTTLMERRNKIK